MTPSLHEIAAMPFPASMLAMRKHYNRDWHKPEPDGETLLAFRVAIGFSYRVDEGRTYTVEAVDEKQAMELAEKAFDADKTVDHTRDTEVDSVAVREQLS